MRNELLKSLAKKPATLLYPFEKYDSIPGSRGKVVIDMTKCIGCGLCIRDCPAFALEMVGKGPTCDMKWYSTRCVFCGQCVETCPRSAIIEETTYDLAGAEKTALMIEYKRPKSS